MSTDCDCQRIDKNVKSITERNCLTVCLQMATIANPQIFFIIHSEYVSQSRTKVCEREAYTSEV